MKTSYSKEHKNYLNKLRLKTFLVVITQIVLLISFFIAWEVLSNKGIINSFFFSSPTKVLKTFKLMAKSGELWRHSLITLKETLIAFFIATGIGFLVAIILWHNAFLKRVLEPYIVVLNSLPKVALGPIIIIWMGAGDRAIIAMGVFIVVIVTTINILNSFLSVDKNLLSLCQSMGANKFQIFFKVVLPNSLLDIISTLKINVGLSWIGAIMGEYLVSKAGLGYLLINAGVVFNLNVIMTVIIVLAALATLMYFVVAILERIVKSIW